MFFFDKLFLFITKQKILSAAVDSILGSLLLVNSTFSLRILILLF